MSNEKYIPVFIDGKPQENLNSSVEEHRCLVGLLANHMDGVPDLRAYKKTRPKRRKLRAADKIIEGITQKSIEVDVIGVVGKTNGQFIHWSIDTINRIRESIGAEWEVIDKTPTSLKWNGYIYPLSHALGLSLYAMMLPIIALKSEKLSYGNTHDVTKIKLCLDALPLSSIEGIELMAALNAEPHIAKMWHENGRRGFSFEVGIFDSYQSDDGQEISGKDHPNAILVDWFAASCLAKVNPEQFQAEGSFSDAEVEHISSIWDTACKQARCTASIIDVDDTEYQRKVNEHWMKINE